MIRRFRSLILTGGTLLLLAGAARADLNLAPKLASTAAGDFSVNRVYFQDGDKKYGVTLTTDGDVKAASGGALFEFKNLSQAKIKLLPSPLPPQVAFDEEGLLRYRKAAVAMLPSSAEDVKIEEAGPDGGSLRNLNGYRFLFSYTVAGSAMKQSVAFINYSSAQQVVLQCDAWSKDFATLQGRAQTIFGHWHLILPEEESGVN